jgi:hypothetical protein
MSDLPATLRTTTLLLDRAIQERKQIGQRTEPEWTSLGAGLETGACDAHVRH